VRAPAPLPLPPPPQQQLEKRLAESRFSLSSGTKLLAVNFPHNPTGCTLTLEEWSALLALARACGCIVFSDEVYRGTSHSEPYELPPACLLYERAISLGALSKAHGLAGLRVGWLISRDNTLLAPLRLAKDFTTICGSAPSEVLALTALRASAAILPANRQLLASNVELVAQFMDKWDDLFEFSRPTAGPVCWPRLISGESADSFTARVLVGCAVLLLPSSVYDFPMEGEEGTCLRLGFGRADCGEVLAVLDAWLADGNALPPACNDGA
jgi:aspartate/methionine/tyrosine aminotransferase